jgi:hypothetical protein
MRSNVPTKDKLEFVFAMAKHSDATLYDCQRLMRYGATFGQLCETACNRKLTEKESAKQDRIAHKIMDLVNSIQAGVTFQHNPRGNTVKIVTRDGYTNDWGREGICVPTS